MKYTLFASFLMIGGFITVSVYSQNHSLQINVKSSLGHSLENATVLIRLTDSPSYQGTIRPPREMGFTHIGDGRYVPSELILLDHSYDAELHLSAPDHESSSTWLYRITGNQNIELFHNNYYVRCNELHSGGSFSFLSRNLNRWDNCEVNDSDLIETFGTEEKNMINSTQVQNYLFNVSLYKYAPAISNDYSQYAPRYRAYRTLFEQILLGTSISLASVHNREFIEWIEAELSENRDVSSRKFILKGAEIITGFSESFSRLNSGLQIAGYTLDILRANREGYLDGLLMVLAHRGAIEEILQRIEERSLSGWLREDQALQNALTDTRADFERMKERNMEEMIRAVTHQRVGDVLDDILFGIVLKNALNAAGLPVFTLVAGKASAGVLASTNTLITSYLIYDFLNSVNRTGEQRALLSAIAQLDRQIFQDIPDHFELEVAESLSDPQKLDMMIRLHLGILFSGARAALFAGEFRTWIGYQFQYSKGGARNANQAYELKMAEISLAKTEMAEKDVERLLSYWFESREVQEDAPDEWFDAMAVTGRYLRESLADDPNRDRAVIEIKAIEGGRVAIDGHALYYPRGDASFGPNIGEFKKQTELQRVNYLEDAMRCSLRIEFSGELMLVEELNRGTMSPCGGHNVTFQGEYRREQGFAYNKELSPDSITDIDGNRYKTVQIGEQLWMAENLRTSRYANGDAIPNVTRQDEWFSLESGAWAYYDNDSGYHEIYGKLYNWFAVEDGRGLCPDGWRVSTSSDWHEMKRYLGLEDDDMIFGTGGVFESGRRINLAGKLKIADGSYWKGNKSIASNESGFSGKPAGQRNFNGFISLGTGGQWWSSSGPFTSGEGTFSFYLDDEAVYSGGFPSRQNGYSVRCLRE